MSDQIVQALTAEGAPFEYSSASLHGHDCRVFKHAHPYLSAIYSALDQYADQDLAVYDDRRLSYAEAAQQAASLAHTLQSEFSIGPGSRVAIAMRNCPEWLVSFIAVTSLGAVAALVNSRGAADEIDYSVSSTNCDLLIMDQKTDALLQDNPAMVAMEKVVFDISKTYSGKTSAGTNLSLDAGRELPQVASEPDDVALILFTSGTTGRPKGALLSHRGVMNALKANDFSAAIIGSVFAQKMGVDLQTLAANQPQAATLLMFPLFHVSGCYSVFLANLVKGGKLVMLSRWSADAALNFIEKEKVTSFPGVPTMYWDLINADNLQDYDLSSMTSLSVAGQSSPVSLLKKINATFPNAMPGSGYGMTETNGVICMTHGEEFINTPESVGRPLSIADIKIANQDGSVVASGEAGEICVRGATVMLGYDNQPEANDKCFVDGWFHTGDVGYLDEEGKLYIVDRITDMIITGGENVYCAEVERVLNTAPGVVELTTFGVPDERLGERLIALVGLSPGSEQTSESLLAHCAGGLASYKVPAELIVIDQPLQRNATGKVLKAQARELYQSLTEAGD